jgi:hypothetical protein
MTSTVNEMFDFIVSACYFFNVLLQPNNEDKNIFGYIPYFALPTTQSVLEAQFVLIQKYLSLIILSNNSFQIKTAEVYGKLYSSAYSIADLILKGYLERNPDHSNQQEFEDIAVSYIDFFVNSCQLPIALKIAAKYEIFQVLVQLSSEKQLQKYKDTFSQSPQFANCLYTHYWKLGKVTTLLEDPLFHALFENNDVLYSLHSMMNGKYDDSYSKYVVLSLNENNLAEKKKLVAIRKLLTAQLDKPSLEENQLQQIINMQDPAYLESLPELKPFQDLLFQYHPRGNYIEPLAMMNTILNNKEKLSFDDFVTLFQIFAYSTTLRNQSKEEAAFLIENIWSRCLQSTNWDELKYDIVRTDSQALAREIRKTLLFQVATHKKHSIYFIPVIVEAMLNESKGERLFLISETCSLIQRSNDLSQMIKENEKRLDKLFIDHILVPEINDDDSLIFDSLLASFDLKSVHQTLHKQESSNSLFVIPKTKKQIQEKLPVSAISDPAKPFPPLKRILNQSHTLPLTLASLSMIPLKPEEYETRKTDYEIEERPNLIKSPVKIKLEQRKNKSVPQSPLKLASASESSDLKNLSPFSNSPNKFRKEFSLSDALIENNIEVTGEDNLKPFDGNVPEFEVPTFNVLDKLNPIGSGYLDQIEAFDNYFEKKQNLRKTPNRNERNKK